MGRGLKTYLCNDSGQVAVIFSLALLPLLALTSAAVDYSQLTKEQSEISSALDAAVLAAANNNAINDAAKASYAETHFRANYSGDVALKLEPAIEGNRVRLTAEGELELTFGGLVGIDNPTLRETRAATIANENTICLMALNETAAEAILFDGGISYSSPTCAVQSNSSNASALTSRSAKTPVAESFCTVGGATGDFAPYVKGECAPIEDPYADVAVPDIPPYCKTPLSELIVIKDDAPNAGGTAGSGSGSEPGAGGGTVSQIAIGQGGAGGVGTILQRIFSLDFDQIFDADLGENLDISQNTSGSDVDIMPGTFCGGLTIDGVNVDFKPGEYIIKDGPLSFINGAEANAEDVTFILAGSDAVLNVQSESKVFLKARKTGPRKGLAVMQAIDKKAPGNRTYKGESSLIAEGGELQVLGTVYLPKQNLNIIGKNTTVGSLAPSTSFVTDTLHISGGYGSKMVIGVDNEAVNMPPILPRAEDGSRLVE